MAIITITQGDDFQLDRLDRGWLGALTPAVFKVSGDDGSVLVNGKKVLAGAAVVAQAAAGHNGAGAVTVAGAVIGDKVSSVTNLTTPGDATASFEAAVTVAGQVQQTSASNLSGSNFLFTLTHQN